MTTFLRAAHRCVIRAKIGRVSGAVFHASDSFTPAWGRSRSVSSGWSRLDAIVQQVNNQQKSTTEKPQVEEEVIDIDSDLLFLREEHDQETEERSTLTPGSTDPNVIKEEVAYSLMAHAPEIPEGDDDEDLTPAQIFYRENRDRLMAQAQEHLLQKRTATDEYEWSYHHEPVLRPPKGHLWSMEDDDSGPREYAVDWPLGELPTIDMIIELLRSEEAKDIVVIDMNECERRDLGSHAIICTCHTSRHSRRLGNLVAKTVEKLGLPHTASYCYGTREDTWVLARLGPICVHLFIAETRPMYQLELLYRDPNKFFQPGDFPHYPLDDLPFDVRLGELRSTSAMLQPYDDKLYEQFLLEDKDEKEDENQ